MKYVYMIRHTASNNNWIRLHKTKRTAIEYLKKLLKEYGNDNIIFQPYNSLNNLNYYNEVIDVEISLSKKTIY